MYSDDPNLLYTEEELESPLDAIEPVDAEEAPASDPEEMLAQLASEDVQQRMIAARAFCELEYPEAIPQLMKLLTDPCPLLRVSVAYALGKNTNGIVVESLINQLGKEWNGYARKGIVWALGNCHDRRSVEPLVLALKEDISAVRLWSASSLAQAAKLEYEDIIKVIPSLIEALRRDPIAAVRSNCAWTIGQLCRELPSNVVYATAIDALIEALVEDEDYGVKEDARSALLRVGDPRGMQMIEELELEGLI